jgi:3-polyprenyl-4-hydroxybenzoate decarboxylase
MNFPEIMLLDDDLNMENTGEIASGSKPGIDATKKIPGEGFKHAWPPLIWMDEHVRKKSTHCLEENHDNEMPCRAGASA